jgi:DNA-binding MarR family transcriptional regulator
MVFFASFYAMQCVRDAMFPAVGRVSPACALPRTITPGKIYIRQDVLGLHPAAWPEQIRVVNRYRHDVENDRFVRDVVFVTIKPKYVNMADVNFSAKSSAVPAASEGGQARPEPVWDVIELLFFAYRDFVGDADAVLAEFGFGRAHHRVLHFVNRNPGIKVADLLDILKITKQSLGRVLKQLVDEGYVIQKEGPSDRRQRLLYVTAKGETLALELAGLQTVRIARALKDAGGGVHEAARRFLSMMIDPESRERVLRMIAKGGQDGGQGSSNGGGGRKPRP